MRRPRNRLRLRYGNLLRHQARLDLGRTLGGRARGHAFSARGFERVEPAAEIAHGAQQQADPENNEPADQPDRAALDQG